jgi:serine/threonine protein phosphatase PrpC
MFMQQQLGEGQQPWHACDELLAVHGPSSQLIQLTTRSGRHGAQGKRKTMQDTDLCEEGIVVPEADINGGAVYCVFDGHGTAACAEYARDHFYEVLLEKLRARYGWRRALWECYKLIDEAVLALDSGAAAVSVVFDGYNR